MASRAGIARFGDGQSTLDARISQQGDQIVSELHGRYYEQAVRKNIFFSLSLVRATSLAAAATIGNAVWNPPDSGVNLSLLKWNSIISVTSATTTAILLASTYQPTVPTTVTAADMSGSTFLTWTGATLASAGIVGKAKAYAIATFLQVPINFTLLHHNTAAINTVGVDQVSGDFEGSIVVPPGVAVMFSALGAAAAAAAHSSYLSWEEIPIL